MSTKERKTCSPLKVESKENGEREKCFLVGCFENIRVESESFEALVRSSHFVNSRKKENTESYFQ